MVNVTYFIGNGFDINLGLKTQYKEFCKWYTSEEACVNDTENITKLKTEIREDIEKKSEMWSDFEIAFGHYTDNIKSNSALLEVVHDIKNKLKLYLLNESDKISESPELRGDFISAFENPSKYIRVIKKKLKQKLDSLLELPEEYQYVRRDDNFYNVNILTLNYTDCIEKIISNTFPIYHLHGTLDEKMIFGVYDENQVNNKELLNDSVNRAYLIKDEFLKIEDDDYKDEFIEIINKTDVLCFFGVSIGETDKHWWELVSTWFMTHENGYIIYFVVTDETDITTSDCTQRSPEWAYLDNKYRQEFIKNIGLPIDLTEEQLSRIYVSINNKEIFRYNDTVMAQQITAPFGDDDLPF